MSLMRISRIFVLVLLATGATALAEVDRDSFPDNLRAMEWREVGPYRAQTERLITSDPPVAASGKRKMVASPGATFLTGILAAQ